MTIYVDWETPKVYTEEEYNELVQTGIFELETNDHSFSDWLNYNYEIDVVFRMTNEDKEDVKRAWLEECKNIVIEDLNCTKYTYACGVTDLLTAFIREGKERGR